MKKSLHAMLAASALVLSFGLATAYAQESIPASEAENSGSLWFVELSGNPTADGSSLGKVQAEKSAFKKAAKAAGVEFTERRSFDTLFNGYSIEVNAANRAKLARVDGVKAIWPVLEVQAPEFDPSSGAAPDLANAIAMSGASIAQNTLGITGAGVKVAIMDTGIDYDHADLGGDGVARNNSPNFPNSRVVAGWDFVGDAWQAGMVPQPDGFPDDCGGHGTHVAGIVGANGAVKGVAPNVQLGAYRVFGCAGSTTTDIMIAAMERALADGMQVLNMSIGASIQNWPQYPTGAAATRAVNKGMVVVASIGNSGPQGSSPNGLYSAGSPGVGAKVIGVASFDNTQLSQPAFTANPGGLLIGFNTATAAPLPPTSGTLPLASPAVLTGCAAADYAGFPAGSAALIVRGGCTFHIKAANAQAAGAAATVMYNNAAGTVNPTVTGPVAITIPFVAITQSDGLLVASLPGPSLTWGNQTVVTAIATGGRISGFSSFGLAADLSMKPDIGAPGGSIFSTVPIEQGRHANNSGTSMSSPHVAGTVALMLEARPNTSSNSMRSRLQNSADPAGWWNSPGVGLDNVHRQGAGMVDIDDTILSTVQVEPGKLSLGESEGGSHVETLTVKNDGSSPVTFDVTHAPALATGPQNATNYVNVSYFIADATVAISNSSVTIPAGGTATVTVTVTPNAGLADRGLYGGYIVLTPQGGGQVYRVPYVGLKGDYQSIQVLTPTGNGFPWLAQLVGGSYFNRTVTGGTYTMLGSDIPYILMHLDHQSRRIRLEAFDANTGKAWHRVSDDEYVTRNSTATGFFAFTWDGNTFTGKGKNAKQHYTVPNGQYVVKVSVLKALGDDNNPAHWETWTSGVITITRP